MSLKLYFTSLAIVITISSVNAAEIKDPRFIKISKEELKKQILQTPLNSTTHAVLISRADTSKLQKLAYEQYTELWRKSPGNANANLRRGVAALNYWRSVAFVNQGQKTDALGSEGKQSLFITTRNSLSKSVELSPHSAPALVAYGFFIWQYDNQMDKGLALLKKAKQIDSTDPKVYANLGAVYSERSGNAYDPDKAESELRKAIKLDRSWAYPYWVLTSVYIDKKNYNEAQWAVNSYSKLANASDMKVYQRAISRGLGKT